MRCSQVVDENAKVATVLDLIPASSDTVESEGRQMKQCWITYIKRKNPKNPPFQGGKDLGYGSTVPW